MGENTKIEWADHTANFWIGCTKVSPACDFCYAERDWDHRKHRVTWGPHGDRSPVKAGPIVCHKVQKGAVAFFAEHGRKPRIFVNSLSDFADNHRSIRPEWRDAVWQEARDCPDVIFMILTKRPQNLPDCLPPDWGRGYPNVWIGCTVENQDEADRRREHLRAVPALVKFVSYEPALGPVDWRRWGFVHWLIAGGESGPKARPSHPDWIRSADEFCYQSGIAFHFKQWGEWAPVCQPLIPTPRERQAFVHVETGKVVRFRCEADIDKIAREENKAGRPLYSLMLNVGRLRAGRLLDGEQHDGAPT